MARDDEEYTQLYNRKTFSGIKIVSNWKDNSNNLRTNTEYVWVMYLNFRHADGKKSVMYEKD